MLYQLYYAGRETECEIRNKTMFYLKEFRCHTFILKLIISIYNLAQMNMKHTDIYIYRYIAQPIKA